MEQAMKAVGENGKLQKIITFIIIATSSLTLILPVSYSYLTKRPEFLCRRHNDISPAFQECEYTDQFCAKPPKFDIQKDPSRSIFNFAYSLDLYCSNAYYVPMLSTLFFFGGILGCIILSAVPDSYGRKNIFTILNILSCFMHINLLFVIGPVHLVLIHFLAGFFSFAYGMSSVIVSEYIARNVSGIVMSVTNGIYPMTGIAVGFFFLFVNNWRLLFIFSTIIHCFVTYLTVSYFFESPRWLNSKGRTEDCLNVLSKIAEINGNTKQWEEFKQANQSLIQPEHKTNAAAKEQTISLFQIVTFRSQRKNFILNTLLWFLAGFCFYGIILNLGHMGGDFFADSVLAFTGEMISELSSGWMSEIFGRIFIMKYGAILGGTAFLSYQFVPATLNWLKSILVFLSTFGFAATFNVVFIYTPELFPTPIRGVVCGFSYLISRLGAMLVSPLSSVLGENADFIFSLFGYLMAFVLMNMEETLGKEMQDDIPEMQGGTSFVASGEYQTSDVKYDTVSDDKVNSYSKYFNK